MKFRDIWELAKTRAKDSLYTLVIIEVIIIMIVMGLQTWKIGLVMLFPFLAPALLIQISKQLLMFIFGQEIFCLYDDSDGCGSERRIYLLCISE